MNKDTFFATLTDDEKMVYLYELYLNALECNQEEEAYRYLKLAKKYMEKIK